MRPHRGENRRQWELAVGSTKPAWRDAYERRGDPATWASVADLVDELGAAPHRLLG